MSKIVAFIISILPFNNLRVFFYRIICGYHIENSKVGFGTIIHVDDVTLIDCTIDSYNFFSGPMSIVIKKGGWIKKGNKFLCGKWSKKLNLNNKTYERYLEIGEYSSISKKNYFDVNGSLKIGKNTTVAGINSQFWTHGAGAIDKNIIIGNHCYIGSAVRFAPGSSIGDNCIVALGSVVTRKFNKSNILLGGHPAKILKENYDWKSRCK